MCILHIVFYNTFCLILYFSLVKKYTFPWSLEAAM